MLSRLAILVVILGQLVASGLCGAVCGPLGSALFADACCVTDVATPSQAGCCAVEPVEPVSCCDSEPSSERPVPDAPEPCPACAMPCCSAPTPAIPPTTTSTQPGTLTYLALAPTPGPWRLDLPEFRTSHRLHAAAPPRPRSCNDRLASLCVWVI